MIDWTKPLELMDGTPVRLSLHGRATGDFTNPDSDGDYWVFPDDGVVDEAYRSSCYGRDGHHEGGSKPNVRNRVETPSALAEPTETLRDRFAMAALTGLCSQADYYGSPYADVAQAAFAQADAMMAARQ